MAAEKKRRQDSYLPGYSQSNTSIDLPAEQIVRILHGNAIEIEIFSQTCEKAAKDARFFRKPVSASWLILFVPFLQAIFDPSKDDRLRKYFDLPQRSLQNSGMQK